MSMYLRSNLFAGQFRTGTLYRMLILLLMLGGTSILLPSKVYGQCPSHTHNFGTSIDASGLSVGVRTQITTVAWGGEIIFLNNLTGGCTYTVDACGQAAYDTYITVEDLTPTVLATGDNECTTDDASATFVPASSGNYTMNLHQSSSCLINTQNTQVYITLVSTGASCSPGTITAQPSPVSICPNASASFTAAADDVLNMADAEPKTTFWR